MKNQVIIQNEAKCKKCGDIIWSGHRHDFKSCSCGAISVDGGMSYIRRVGDLESIEERSLSTDKTQLMDCVAVVEMMRADNLSNMNIYLAVDVIYGIDELDFFKNRQKVGVGLKAVKWGIEERKNSLGIVLAVIRALRDSDYLDMSKFNQE